MPELLVDEGLALVADESVEMLPRRAALGCHGINITTITAVNLAIAVNAGTINGQALAGALQGIHYRA